jgi:hypothetical protein
MKNFLNRHVGAVVAMSLGLAVVGGGVAAAATASSASRPALNLAASTATTPAPSTTTAPGEHAGRAGRPGYMLHHAVHGDFIIKTKNGWETITFDRGTVTAVSATSITVHRPDGVSVTKRLDANTRYKGITEATAIAKGQPAVVISHAGTALAVGQRPPSAGSSGSSSTTATNSAGS